MEYFEVLSQYLPRGIQNMKNFSYGVHTRFKPSITAWVNFLLSTLSSAFFWRQNDGGGTRKEKTDNFKSTEAYFPSVLYIPY
jgi:hypothetical protein